MIRSKKMGNEINSLNSSIEKKEYKIRNELEPRIKEEKRAYDSFVLNGGSDPCFLSGMSGNCGIDCETFGKKSECFDSFTIEQAKKLYSHDGYVEFKNFLVANGEIRFVNKTICASLFHGMIESIKNYVVFLTGGRG